MPSNTKEYTKEYYKKNKIKIGLVQKLYYQKNKKNYIDYFKKYYSKNRENYLKQKKEQSIESKNMVLDFLGGKCVKCGFSDYRALQIDHVNGGGVKEQRERTTNRFSYHKEVMDSFTKKEGKYQLLCANCNWIKRFVRGETRK
jgi:RNase P subunit RPR2